MFYTICVLEKEIHQGGMLMFNQLRRKKKGQSTLEYIILVTGVIVVLIFFLRQGGPFATAFNTTLGSGTNGMTGMADRLGGSRGTQPNGV
jgi:hypothetical protein